MDVLAGLDLYWWQELITLGSDRKKVKTYMCIFTGILAHRDKVQLQDKGHNSESYSFGVIPLLN